MHAKIFSKKKNFILCHAPFSPIYAVHTRKKKYIIIMNTYTTNTHTHTHVCYYAYYCVCLCCCLFLYYFVKVVLVSTNNTEMFVYVCNVRTLLVMVMYKISRRLYDVYQKAKSIKWRYYNTIIQIIFKCTMIYDFLLWVHFACCACASMSTFMYLYNMCAIFIWVCVTRHFII